MVDARIKGQEVSIRIIDNGVVLSVIDSISNFNDSTDLEIKQAGYLGEFTDRFDEILNGWSADAEIHLTNANAVQLEAHIVARATRQSPNLVFNIVRTDIFPNGGSNVYTYVDVKWGAIPTTIGSRGDYVKKKLQVKTSTRTTDTNALP